MKPFGWYCELVHDASGEVVNTGFWRDAPIKGPHDRMKGYTWRATALALASRSEAPAAAGAAQAADGNKIMDALENYRCANFRDEDGGLPLSDALAAAFGDKDIGRATQELQLISDAVLDVLAATPAPEVATTADPLPGMWEQADLSGGATDTAAQPCASQGCGGSGEQ